MSNILLLQGPLGPFFKQLQSELQRSLLLNVDVHRIVFNAGDQFFAGKHHVHAFTQAQDQWAQWLSDFVKTYSITHILVYGDCRFYHKAAAEICENLGLKFWAFEEGYLRPNHITCERFGANANSKTHYEEVRNWQIKDDLDNFDVRSSFYYTFYYAAVFYWAMLLGKSKFKLYIHHRDSSPMREGAAKIRSFLRHYLYKFKQKSQLKFIKQHPFFLVPLQVFNDSQLTHHSPFESMQAFIETTVESFAVHSQSEDVLVIKHHPADRGECNYQTLIDQLTLKYDLVNRLIYVHDLHLPSLLKQCKGVISINSTTVLGAFHHSAPVKILGEAFYDIKGLACEGSLDDFWTKPTAVNHEFYLQLRDFLRHTNQFNGSFYSDKDLAIKNFIHFFKDKV